MKTYGLLFICFFAFSCANRPAGGDNFNEKRETYEDGFGVKNKRSGTTSASSIETTNENSTLDNYLRQIPGVTVSGDGIDAEVRVRGIKSLYGDTTPLFVIDGSPVNGGFSEVFSMVQVRDISRVSVLKDGGLYGARGGAGVIVIRTKK